jgi:hypothetical protein
MGEEGRSGSVHADIQRLYWAAPNPNPVAKVLTCFKNDLRVLMLAISAKNPNYA